MGAHEMIRDRALECATENLSATSGQPEDAIHADIAPAMEFMATHCRLAAIEAISTRFVAELDSESTLYNEGIAEVIKFLGGSRNDESNV